MDSIVAVTPSNVMDNEKMKYILESSRLNGFELTIIGIGKEFSWQKRMKWFQEYLKTTTAEIVCFTDAYDVFYLDNLNTIKEKFLTFQCDIVFAAEKWYSHQLPSDKKFYDEMCHTEFGYKYLNAGTFIGYSKTLLRLFDDILEKSLNDPIFIEELREADNYPPEKIKGNDQTWISHHISRHNNWNIYNIKLDYYCKIFYLPVDDWEDIDKYIDPNMKVISTGQNPSIIHVTWKARFGHILTKLFDMKYKTICLNCLLFTLKGSDVKTNKYIPIFNMWLSRLITDGGIRNSDTIHFYVDTPTIEYLKTDIVFTQLIQKCPCEFQVYTFPEPETILDGMMYRFKFLDYTQDIYMYCDIDILFVKSIHLLTKSLNPNTIYIHNEGKLSNQNYGAAFTKEELDESSEKMPGFSSGKFIIYGKELHKNFFEIVTNIRNLSNQVYYTLDQPYFNKAIYYMILNKLCSINFDLIRAPIISVNGRDFTSDTVLLDAMGIPGDGEFHFNKLLDMYIILHSNAFLE